MSNGYSVGLGWHRFVARRQDGSFKWTANCSARHTFASLADAQEVADQFNVRLPGIVKWEVQRSR